MKDSTKRNFALLSALVMSGYFAFSSLVQFGNGNLGYGLFGIAFGVGMAATLIALFKKPTEGKLYNTVILLGRLPSLAFTGFAIWLIVTGTFTPSSLFALIIGVIGLLTDNMVISKNEEGSAEAND